MANFTPRTTAPSTTDKNWIKTTKGGYNHAMEINSSTGSVLPNCCGYVHGRWLELGLNEAVLSRGNADSYFGNTSDGFERGQIPRLGAIMCWSCTGKAGHVAIVEGFSNSTSVTASQSNYGGTRFYTKTFNPNSWPVGYNFQGYIYPNIDFKIGDFTNSSLVSYTRISPKKNSPRVYPITKITIHHMAGNLTLEQCGELFQTRQASSNYGIDSNGKVALYVDEKDRSWCSSSYDNDNRAVTIEVANNGGEPDWHVSDAAYNKIIDLCVDICKRNNIAKLTFTGDKSGNLTQHNYFAATACPGPYLKGKFAEIATMVNKRLDTEGDVGTPVKRNKEVNQVEVNYSDLNGRKRPELVNEVIVGTMITGLYNVISTKDMRKEASNGYLWYQIEDNLWIADVGSPDVVYLAAEEVDYSAKVKIGFASSGDLKKIQTLLDSLSIGYTIPETGYIITSVAPSKGDRIQIDNLCYGLGVPCVEYSSDNNTKIKELEQKIAILETQIESLQKGIIQKDNELKKCNSDLAIQTEKIEEIRKIVE